MTAARNTDVVIVGAGPTGLSLAAQLLRYGVDFIVIEKNTQPTHLSKAIVIQARTLEIFREIGLDAKAVAQGSTAMAFNLYHNGRKRARLDLSGLGQGQSYFPFVLSLEQSKTEKLLVGHLADHGKKILWNCGFSHYTETSKGITVHFENPEGELVAVNANYLAGCDGASSAVRREAGLAFEGDTIPKIFYVADAVLDSPIINKPELSIFLIDNGFVLFFPMEGSGHYRIIGILPEMTEEQAATITFADIEQPIVKKLKVPISFTQINWFSHYKVHSRMAKKFRAGRCFILGDAAHIHTPAGGQGMNTGIQDAYNLAWKIAFAQRCPNDDLLESYSEERTINAQRLLRTTDRMFDFMAGKHWYSDFFRLHIFPAIAGLISQTTWLNRLIFPLLSQTGIAYGQSPLTISGQIGEVKSGDRMPYFALSDGSNIFDYLADPNFKLLHFGDRPDFSTVSKFGIPTKSFKEIPAALFGKASGFYVLLRPDNHISYIGRDLSQIVAFLVPFFNPKTKLT